MEETEVVIVGAGPSGLVLALALAKHGVNSVILEKGTDIDQDPRGVVIQGDAVRSVYSLGLGRHMDDIGHALLEINFHVNNFQRKPFLIFNTDTDHNEQSLPSGILQVQPRFERALRELVDRSKFASLRTGCEVVDRQETPDGVLVEYKDGTHRSIKASWLVGADGKTGVVRKRFLEPAGIKQVVGRYEYTGTWVAANLKIDLPTPKTHPKFPLWDLGYTPEQIYDIFWPTGWHFCTHPTRATATGRFGPEQDRYWRHEFAVADWEEAMDPEEELWKHLTPSITRDPRSFPGVGQTEPVGYPRDCIKVLRCRPFTFTQKVASPKWYHNRTIIIGDAAHVFPPFGGQGIASGIRDAMALSWRLAMLLRFESTTSALDSDSILGAWNRERRSGINHAVAITMTNGRITNQTNPILVLLQVLFGKLLMSIPPLLRLFTSSVFRNDLGYISVKDGFFLPSHGGGGKLSQVYLKTTRGGKPFLSDDILWRSKSLFTIVAIVDDGAVEETETLNSHIEQCGIDSFLISKESTVLLAAEPSNWENECQISHREDKDIHYLCSEDELRTTGIIPFPGYDENSYRKRLGQTTRYAIIRPDCILFSVSKDLEELRDCVERLKSLTQRTSQLQSRL